MISKRQRKSSRKHAKHFHGNKYVSGIFLTLDEKKVMADLTIKHDQIPTNRVEKRERQRQNRG